MAITIPTTLTSLLVGERVNYKTPVPTDVNGDSIASVLELKSTTGAFVLPRMDNTQMNALTPVVDGMMIYNKDAVAGGAIYVHQNGAWTALTGGGGSEDKTITVTFNHADILSLRNTVQALPILPAPGVDKAYVVKSAIFTYKYDTSPYSNAAPGVNGTALTLCYGVPATITTDTTNPMGTTSVAGTILTTTASQFFSARPSTVSVFDISKAQNQPLTLSSSIVSGSGYPFTGGGANSTLAVTVQYTIIPFVA